MDWQTEELMRQERADAHAALWEPRRAPTLAEGHPESNATPTEAQEAAS